MNIRKFSTTTLGNLSIVLKMLNPLDAYGFTKLSTGKMETSTNKKKDLLRRVLRSRKGFIMRKKFLLWLNGTPSD